MCNESLPHSRKEAKEQGATRYFTGKPCKHGHVDARKTSSGSCVTCYQINYQEWYKNNKDYFAAWQRNKRETAGPEYVEKLRQQGKKRYRKNPGPYKQRAVERQIKKQARSFWGQQEVRKIYENCPAGQEVDHIIPLSGKEVCGLHVPENLRYVPRHINRRKSNKLLPDLVQAET